LGKILSETEGKDDAWYMKFTADYLDELTTNLNIGKLGSFGVTRNDLAKIASVTDHKANPVHFEMEELEEMLQSRL
jgi:alcohol dehydrogenase class IV